MTNIFASGFRPWREYRWGTLLLAALSVIAYGRLALLPSLLGDEWGFLYSYVAGTLRCPNWDQARALTPCWHSCVHALFGANAYGHHGALLVAQLVAAVLLWITLRHLWPKQALLCWMVAALHLVYPAWWSRMVYGDNLLGLCAFLLTACILAHYWRFGGWRVFAIGMLFLYLSFRVYEQHFGVISAMSVCLFLIAKGRLNAQRLALLVPAVATAVYSIWRWLWQLSVGAAYGHSVDSVSFSPSLLFNRLIYGIRVNLQWAWTDLIVRLVPYIRTGDKVERILSALVLGALIVGTMLVVATIVRLKYGSDRVHDEALHGRWSPEMKSVTYMGIGGFIVLCAGFFPVILVDLPDLSYSSSRMNQLPSIGAAMFICAVLFGAGRLLSRSSQRAGALALAGFVPLLALGLASQFLVGQQTERAWSDQKEVWNQLFELAPDFAEGTNVLLFLEGNNAPLWGPQPFIGGPWGFSGALNLLYGKRTLRGEFAYGSADDLLRLEGADLLLPHRTFPVDNTVVFGCDGKSRTLKHLAEIERDGKKVKPGDTYILPSSPPNAKYRWLVR